ncbi:hypothetical protein [Xanthocytophaga agilis]|uniref:GAF domain-containing protein n=1 Tax=Xanthocytophaga agilis TaxID=3048010 RepID=A0AAE3RA59_9BACT|nr:hypothetical protein [Xanthocytophaga agilis]MDJ1504342.1 hypothetical protein [Xanthocytophaga agilis]
MNFLPFVDSPLRIQLSFEPAFEHLERVAADSTNDHSVRAKRLLADLAPYPELRTGLTDITQITENTILIQRLLADYFPPELTLNEIKAVSLPYTNIVFNHSERFKNILKAAGPDFEINIRDFDEHQFYILSCCLILNEFYGTQLDFSKPLFYDIPTAEGILKHYRILYNGDFLEVSPTENAVLLSQEDIELLINSYDNISLWKEKFPQESWQIRGFGIMTLFDATVENAVSIFKEKLLGINSVGFQQSVESVFRSIFRLWDIKIGFSFLNPDEHTLNTDPFGQQIGSFLLEDNQPREITDLLGQDIVQNFLENRSYFAISNTTDFRIANPHACWINHLITQGVQSIILTPVIKNGLFLGILEVVAFKPRQLNSINANKLDVVMPFLTDTIERLAAEWQNQIQAVIQTNYTTIHKSVYWKFRAEAESLIYKRQLGISHALNEIVFPEVYPLYGQIDIKGSSEARNASVQKDLIKQIKTLLNLFKKLDDPLFIHSFVKEEQQLQDYLTDLSMPLRASTEQYISGYISRIHTRLRLMSETEAKPLITEYFRKTDRETGSFHIYRRKYENTIHRINQALAEHIDMRQVEAQDVFPHYYERFKTDGIEHNLYIGHSIAPRQEFDTKKLYALRLWQLQVLCEMESIHHAQMRELPYPLAVTTLILVYNSAISIRFRMDEKRFDVDGSYNARFEIIKKRIDKACIKGTTNRITQVGKITIVYSNYVEEQEYLHYIKTLQARNMLAAEIEQFEVEDLQGVSGLKMLRATILHANESL